MEQLRLFNNVSEAIRGIPQVVATEAVNFSKERFVAQNWVDFNTQPWAKRKRRRGGKQRNRGAVLVSSGRLKRSIRKILVTTDMVVIGSDVPYAQIHNDGFRGCETVKAHKRKDKSGRKKDVRSHTRNMNMPRRRFLGESSVLTKRIERVCTANIMRAIKNSF